MSFHYLCLSLFCLTAFTLAACDDTPNGRLDRYPDPADYGCTAYPTNTDTVSVVWDEASEDCRATSELYMTALRDAPTTPHGNEAFTAWRYQRVPLSDCRFSGVAQSPFDEEVFCDYTFDARVGVKSDEEMSIDIDVHVVPSPGCWLEACDFTVRKYYYKDTSGIILH